MDPYNATPMIANDKYTVAPIEIVISHNVRMKKTGITPPGFPVFAVYRPTANRNYVSAVYTSDKFYVYEGGYFWEAREWRQHFSAHGQTPLQTRQPATTPDEG